MRSVGTMSEVANLARCKFSSENVQMPNLTFIALSQNVTRLLISNPARLTSQWSVTHVSYIALSLMPCQSS